MQEVKILLEKKNLIIRILPDLNIVEGIWLGYQRLDLIQEGCVVMQEIIENQGFTKILNDLTPLSGTISFAQEWLNTIWLPEMISKGLLATAYIYSPDVFAQRSLNRIFEKRSLSNYQYQAFKEREEAIHWLTEIK